MKRIGGVYRIFATGELWIVQYNTPANRFVQRTAAESSREEFTGEVDV
jgi:hypothetical protein